MGRPRQDGWERIVADFRRSGLTQEAFARQRDVKLTTLQSWLYRRVPAARVGRRTQGDRSSPAFVPVAVRPRALWARPDVVEVQLSSGVALRFAPSTDLAYVLRLAEGLARC